MNPGNGNAQGARASVELVLRGEFGEESFTLRFSDPEVLAVLQRVDANRGSVVETMIRVGTYALQAGSSGFDVRAVRLELERAADNAGQALSDMQTHVAETMGQGGTLAAAVDAAGEKLMTAVAEVIARQSDGDVPGTLVAKVQAGAKSVEEVMSGIRDKIRDDLRQASERQTDALSKAVRDVRDLDPASGMGSAVSRIEKAIVELTTVVAATAAVGQERERGTAKGALYEDEVAVIVASIAQVYGDRAEQTGGQPGKVILNKRPSCRGDVTCYAGGAPLVVLEVMDRNSAVLSSNLVIPELDAAIGNRGVRAAIAVVSSADNPLMCQQPLQILGPDKWAVVLEKDGGSLLALKVAYRLARASAMREESHESNVDVERIKSGLGEINRGLILLGDVRSQLSNIRGCEAKASEGLLRYEREVTAAVLRVTNELIVAPTEDAA